GQGGTFKNCVDWRTRAPSPLKNERHACKSKKGRAGAKHLSGKLFHGKANIAGPEQKNKRCSCKKEKAVETAFFYSLAVALNIAAECIAGFQLSAIETALEPFGALG